MIFLFKTYYNLGQRLVLQLTFAAFLNLIPYLMGHNHNGPECSAQGFLMTWTDWALLMSICCITHKIAINVTYQRNPKLLNVSSGCGAVAARLVGPQVAEVELVYYLMTWIFTLVLACIPIIWDGYGPAGPWCWIQEDQPHTTGLRFGLWYIPLFTLIFVLLVGVIYIFRRVTKQQQAWQGTYSPEIEAEKEFILKQVKPIRLYPVMFLCLQFFPLVNRIQNASDPDDQVFALTLLHVISTCSTGFALSFVFAANTDRTIWNQCNRAGISRALMMRRKAGANEFPNSYTTGFVKSPIDDDDDDGPEIIGDDDHEV